MRCPWSCLDFLKDLFHPGMGAGASTSLSEEEKRLEDFKTRLGRDYTILTTAYSRLAKAESSHEAPIYHSKLEKCFSMSAERIKNIPDDETSDLGTLLKRFGLVLTQVMFKPENEQVSWIGFLTGYDSICQPGSPASSRLSNLLSFFCTLRSSESGSQLGGSLSSRNFRDFLWLCWLMMYYNEVGEVELPDVEAVVQGAMEDKETNPVEALQTWIVSNIPGLGSSLVDYVQSCLQKLCQEEKDEPSGTLSVSEHSGDLAPARLWCLGLSHRDRVGELLLSAVLDKEQLNLLYRSSVHGKGMNRFWSQVEGYRGDVLFLVSGTSNSSKVPWTLAAVISGGMFNRDTYYGASGCCLFTLDPKLVVLRATGHEKNCVYSHRTMPGGGYVAKQSPNGIGFGGRLGNERIWIDDDFATVTIRHHSVDKTYQSGQVLPHQGYGPVCEQVFEVGVWGLGGKTAEEEMEAFQQREKLFAQQRRKVDLKSFAGNWQDSPEKMMMNMLSNPNAPQREQR